MSRGDLILSLADTVNILARTFRSKVPRGVTLDDLVSAGWLGAIQAVDGYDPNRGASLKVYAQHRITGSIQDHLRSSGPLGRGYRQALRAGRAGEIKTTSLDSPGFYGTRMQLADVVAPRMLSQVVVHQTLMKLFARAKLGPRNANMLMLYFLHNRKLAQIAKRYGITEGRVSQAIAFCLGKLRSAQEARTRKPPPA